MTPMALRKTAGFDVSWNIGGRKGGTVRYGDYLVPRCVTVVIDPDDGDPHGLPRPRAVLEFEIRDGVPVCTELRIVSGPGDLPVLRADVATLDPEAIGAVAYAQAASRITQVSGGTVTAERTGNLDNDAYRAVRSALPANYVDTATELRAVAEIYLHPQNRAVPTKAVEEALGYTSRATVARRVRAARSAGLIPPLGADDAALDDAYRRLTVDVEPKTRTPDEVRRLLRSMADGSLNAQGKGDARG